ncbi:hypothetical protein AGMMS49546_16770 [Spirochaetia bacterium]|nr:hypothetical protein AGMMS49546_16770 [Spirochaetia bacterium]
MKYIEGVDKIKLLLNPLFINAKIKKWHIDPYNRLRIDRAGSFMTLQIQDEYFIPEFDYQMQIAIAIYELIKKGVINFPDTIFTPWFIYKNHELFILNPIGLELYSDFRYDNLEIKDMMSSTSLSIAKEENILFQYTKDGIPTNTHYTNDFGSRTASAIIYDKNEKNMLDNHIDKMAIKNYPNGKRFEWKIYSNNSDWLHWDNLAGNYKTIFNRYKEYLAVIYNNYIAGCIEIHGKENKNFHKVRKLAETSDRKRYTGSKLKTAESIPEEILHSDKATIRKKAITIKKEILGDFGSFSVKKTTIKKVEYVAKIIEECEDKRRKFV